MTEGNSWICQRQSAWQSHNLNCMTVNPHTISANVGLSGYNTSDLPVDKEVKIKDEGLFVQHQTSLPTMNPYPNEQQSLFPSGFDGKGAPDGTSYSQQKKFLIFDRSGEETRMLFSTICSPMCNPTVVSANPLSTYKFPEKLHAFKSEQSCPKAADFFGDSGENHVMDEGSDYHEDTEEIDALLYSSNDEIDDDSCDGKDEDELSTDHSPVAMEAGFENLEEGEAFDEVSSLGLSSKRQKLLDADSCSKLSLVDTKKMAKPAPQMCEDESVVNLNTSNGEQTSPSVGCKRLRRHDIHDTLRILQKLIPGSKGKDALVIIDEAITYLKSLKANSLYMEGLEAEGSSCHGSFL